MKLKQKPVVFTVGHSTREIAEFIEMLRAFNINLVVDIRTIPRSRHNPQFNKEALPVSLKKSEIKYVHVANLGGLRKPREDSINLAWRNESFRGFADYMQTRQFESGLNRLIRYSQTKRPVIMCAEAVPWRCHRSLIGDALTIRGVETRDIYSPKIARVHKLTPWSRVRGKKITYPLEKNVLKAG